MGKSKDKKKKGHGMEKTLAKTEKKEAKRIKKDLEEIGEDDVEKLLASYEEREKELAQAKEELSGPPSARSGASLNVHPEKDELVLFGGEYYDGSKIYMYNDLFIYNIKKNQWTTLKVPKSPKPRSSHQGAIVSRNQGELWIFGGEFASPSQSQFYHFNDLWVLRFDSKSWDKINATGAPSPRSGHRMITFKKYLVVFGGFHDNLRTCKYFNDTYTFNLETNQWTEIKFSSVSDVPSPRSACQLTYCQKTSAIILFGGFSKEKLKKDEEKGVVHTDMFALTNETKKDGKNEWLWKKCKQTGTKPSNRCSFTMITTSDDSAYLFGGVFDFGNLDDEDDDEEEENDENVKSQFYNDLYRLDLTNYKWIEVKLKGKKAINKKSSKKNALPSASSGNTSKFDAEDDDEEMDVEEADEAIDLDEESKTNKDDVYQLSFSDNTACKSTSMDTDEVVTLKAEESQAFCPLARRSCNLQYHKGIIYLFGGCFEAKNGREITLNDMYALNLKKQDEWKTLVEDKNANIAATTSKVEVLNESDQDNDDDSDDSEMEIDAPELEENETRDEYFKRTQEFWIDEARKEFPDEKSKKILHKMSSELCNLFFESINK